MKQNICTSTLREAAALNGGLDGNISAIGIGFIRPTNIATSGVWRWVDEILVTRDTQQVSSQIDAGLLCLRSMLPFVWGKASGCNAFF